jgi:polysaccharide biosynthesis protein PslH
MKILIISSYLPYPLYSGGHIRLYNLIKNLSDKHEITLICEKRNYQIQKDADEVSKICEKVITVERKKQWSARNILRSGVSLSPFLLVGHNNPEMKKQIIKEIENNKFDLIHVETFYVMQNLPKSKIPTVLVEHNIEYLVYERFVKKASVLAKPLLHLDILKLKRAEKKCWKKANKLIAVSLIEQKIMGEKAEVVPNGVDIEKFKFKKINKNKTEKKVLFIGDFKWIQNKDSIVYIIKNIWPRTSAKNPNLKLWVVGRSIPDSVKKLGNDSIIFDENASEHTELIFQEADLLLSPIRVGGGTNFKILESMSSGTPVVTTALGNEGINAKDKSEILISEKPDEFVTSVSSIFSDKYLYEKLSRNGRKFIEENFDWRNIAKKLDDIYSDLAN